MITKQKKVQDIRDSLLDERKLDGNAGDSMKNPGAIMALFDSFKLRDSIGSQNLKIHGYEGGSKNGSRVEQRNDVINSSLNQSLNVSQLMDLETKNQKKEDYLQSLLNQSPNRHEALDLFLLLDRENDQFLKYEEIDGIVKIILDFEDENDRGKIKTEADFKKMFESFGWYQMDDTTFNEFVDKAEFNVSKVRDQVYSRTYGGCCAKIFCLPCKCCCKLLRKKMVAGVIKKEDEMKRLLYNEEEPKRSKLQDIIALVLSIVSAKSEVMHHITDLILCNTVYWTGMKPENHGLWSYKFATVYIFMSLTSVYLIAYSSMINMLLFKGVYEPQSIKRNNCCQVAIKIIFLSFLGPFYFVGVELVSKLMAVCAAFGMLTCGKSGYLWVRIQFLKFIDFVFSLNEEQIDGLNKQRGVVQLLFESLPMSILQLLIRYEIIECKELMNKSSFTLFISLLTCVINIFVITFMIYTESKALTEPFLDYVLNSFKARQGWIPFLIQIENNQLKQAVDYGEVRCQYPLVTGPSGIYKAFKFMFSDTSLQGLTSALVKWDSTIQDEIQTVIDSDDDDNDGGQYLQDKSQKSTLLRNKYIMDLGQSLTYVSINVLLHFYHLSPKKRIQIKLSHLNLQELIINAKKSGLIYKPSDSDLKQARTPSGVHLLWICAEDEKKNNPSSLNLYETQLGIQRRFKIIKLALDCISKLPNNYDAKKFIKKLEAYDGQFEGGTFKHFEDQTLDVLVVKNKTKLRSLNRLGQKGVDLLKECQEYILRNDITADGVKDNWNQKTFRENLQKIPSRIESFLKIVDESSLKIDQAIDMIDKEIADFTIDENQQAYINDFKQNSQNTQDMIKQYKNEIKNDTEQLLLEIEEGNQAYSMMSLLAPVKELESKFDVIESKIKKTPEDIKGKLASILVDLHFSQKKSEENEDLKFVYQPNEEEKLDVAFAKAYTEHEKGKYPVKFVGVNPNNEFENQYEYFGFQIFARILQQDTILLSYHGSYPEISGQPHTFFNNMQKEYQWQSFQKKLKDAPILNLIGSSLKFQVLNAPLNGLCKKFTNRLNELESESNSKTLSMSYSQLLQEDLINNFEDVYEQYKGLLPPKEELTIMSLDDVPEFNEPSAWLLQNCMKLLLFEENCDPNIQDNYGETLLNYSIKHHKQQSIRYIINSKLAKINAANAIGVTPVGQAFISWNIEALRRLLHQGANIHAKCILDPGVTRKLITPLHYFIKRIRLQGVDVKGRDKQMLQLLIKNKVKAKTEDEKIGLLRQLCRMFSTADLKEPPTQVIEQYLLPLIETESVNLLEFRDKKSNNALHLFIKGKQADRYGFLRNHIYDYMPKDLNQEERLNGLKSLLNQKNDYDHFQLSPLEQVFVQEDEKLIPVLCQNFVEKFNQDQIGMCLDYIFSISHENYDHMWFRGTRLGQLVSPLLKYFPDQEKAKDTLQKMAQSEKPAPNKRVLFNLYKYINIGENVEMGASREPTQSRNVQKDENYKSQKITIEKTADLKNKTNGTYMRFMMDEQASMKSKLQSMIKRNVRSIVVDSSISKKQSKEKPPNPYFEFAFTLILEMIACFDMFGDIYLLVGMYKFGHTAWFTISIFTMLSPFYVCYVPLLTFQKNRGKLQKETKFLKVLNVLSMTPLIVSYLLLMDIIYIVVSVIIMPIAFTLKLLSCGFIDFTNIEEKLDVLYEILFGMSDMDIKGFRRLRTISQLSFESLPQIILQVRILIYALNGENKLGVDLSAIIGSLCCAILHAFFEMIFVHLEAVACKTTIIHYFIVCFNARFGWIPFVNFFSSLAGFDEDAGDQQENLDYEGMKSQICGVKFQMHFNFSNSSCAVLINSLINLREEKDPSKRMDLKIGESLNDVDFPLIMDLMVISNNRINLDISEVNLLQIIKQDEETMKDLTTEKTDGTQEYVIQRVARLGQSSVVAQILQIENLYLGFKPTLLDIAKSTKNYDLAKLIVNSKDFEEQLAQVTNNQCLMETLIKVEKNPIIQACLFSNVNIIVPEQYQFLILLQVIDYLMAKDYQTGHLLLQHIFGSMDPQYLLRGVGRLQTNRMVHLQQKMELYNLAKPMILEFQKKFPPNFYFHHSEQDKKEGDEVKIYSIPTEVASCFSVLRDLVIRKWNFNSSLTYQLGSEDAPFDIASLKIDHQSLLTVGKLMTDDHVLVTSLKPEEVRKCDQVVKRLGLDKHRATYFHRSRENDQTQSLYTIKASQDSQVSIDQDNVCREPNYKTSVVIVKNNFSGMTHKGFEFKLPPEVFAVRRFMIIFQYMGGSVQMNHLSRHHQSSFEISNERHNKWETQNYTEVFSEVKEEMQGFKDILSGATGGDIVQIWLTANGYAFTRSVHCEFDVITHEGQQLKITAQSDEKQN